MGRLYKGVRDVEVEKQEPVIILELRIVVKGGMNKNKILVQLLITFYCFLIN